MIALARLIIAVAKLIFSLFIFMFSPPFLNSVYIVTLLGYKVNGKSQIYPINPDFFSILKSRTSPFKR
jgi:hypothetical protein|nr:MAG TPA: hypothetical protein [Caudoviricetes sp.]